MTELALALCRQFLVCTALLVPLELVAPARRQPLLRRGAATDLVYFVASPLLINLGSALALALLAVAVDALLPVGARRALGAQPVWLQLVEIFALAELGHYALHRASHASRWLWRFHAVHHSNEELDWLAAHRQHPLEAVALLAVANLPLLVLGFPAETLGWFVVGQKLYTAFLHANVRVGYGPLGAVLASPQFHHWHHDGAPDAPRANFASTLPLLDVVFGTYRAPRGFPSRYGTGEPMPRGWLGQLAHPFVDFDALASNVRSCDCVNDLMQLRQNLKPTAISPSKASVDAKKVPSMPRSTAR